MNWNLEGLAVEGIYLSDIAVAGKVLKSRVKYGGSVQHLVELNHAFDAGRGIARKSGETVFVEHKDITRVMEAA